MVERMSANRRTFSVRYHRPVDDRAREIASQSVADRDGRVNPDDSWPKKSRDREGACHQNLTAPSRSRLDGHAELDQQRATRSSVRSETESR